MVPIHPDRNRRIPPKIRFNNSEKILLIVFFVTIFTILLAYGGFYISSTQNDTNNYDGLSFTNESNSAVSEGLTKHFVLHSESENFNSDLSDLTPEQLIILKQLKDELSGNFTHEYMKSNYFLLQWLKDNNWDLEDTIEMLIEHLEWRKTNKMDEILNTNFEDMKHEFPYYADAVDRENRPVVTIDISTWDLRKATISGKGEKFLRSVMYGLSEWSFQRILSAREESKNVTQFMIIVSLGGFSIVQHACFACLKYCVKGMYALLNNYPGMLHKIILINSPEEFDIVLSLTPSVLENLMEVYGSDKTLWKKAILSYVSPDQIRPEFGGIKNADHDY